MSDKERWPIEPVPCPKCGKPSTVYELFGEIPRGERWFAAGCFECDIGGPAPCATPYRAIDKWNEFASGSRSRVSYSFTPSNRGETMKHKFILDTTGGKTTLRKRGAKRALINFDNRFCSDGFFGVFSSAMTHADKMETLTIMKDGFVMSVVDHTLIELFEEDQ